MAPDRKIKVNEEIQKLLDASFIRPVIYPTWVSNVVAVPKKDGKIRVCIDFTNLNKACPVHPYPLPCISDLVDATNGFKRLSFMDAFSGYNQIMLEEADQEHTTFITDSGLYCYKVMPFGLKNAGATYQKLINKIFDGLLGKNVEAYIDDMVVKTRDNEDHLLDLKTAFDRLALFGMRLNPKKCSFGVSSGKFLGYLMTERGIEANPSQIRSILEMPRPKNKKEMQRLTGHLAALNRFISRYSDKCHQFFKALKENETWNDQCEQAFSSIKGYLTSPPILTSPKVGETIGIYLATSENGVSAVLFIDDKKLC